MTKKEAFDEFKASYGEDGAPYEFIQARFSAALRKSRETVAYEWSVYTDALCKGNRITLKQYEGWVNPF